LEVHGVKVEMEKVRERQLRQEVELEDLRLVIPLLLPESEQKHLRHLAVGTGSMYTGKESLRSELRRLRSIGLIRSRTGHSISQMRDGVGFVLQDHVALTDLGRRWAERLAELETDPTVTESP
jgi:hypothetical protein